jgi:PAS domain S-box-containing protein
VGGLVPDPGLIEGLAVAASPRDEDLSAEQWARAMKELGVLPPLERLFALGFLGENSSTAYTASGAFVSWVRDIHGSEVLRRWYGGESLATLTGESWAELERRWHEVLDAVELPESARVVAEARFKRPGFFARSCPRAVDACRERSERLADRGDIGGAIAELDRAAELDPHDSRLRLERAELSAKLGEGAERAAALAEIVADESLPQQFRDQARQARADLALWAGSTEEAASLYEELLPRTLDEARLRTLHVKLAAARDAQLRPAITALLIAREGEPQRAHAYALLGELRSQRPEDGTAWYLIGRARYETGDWAGASEDLEGALARRLEIPHVRLEALRLAVLAACSARDPERARRRLEPYLAHPDARPARRDTLRRLVSRCEHGGGDPRLSRSPVRGRLLRGAMRCALSEILEVALRHSSVVGGGAVVELVRALEPHASFEAFGIACSFADGSVEPLAAPDEMRTLIDRACSALSSAPSGVPQSADGARLRSVSLASGGVAPKGFVAVYVPCLAGDGSREPDGGGAEVRGRVPLLVFVCESDASAGALPTELLRALARALLPSIARSSLRTTNARAENIIEAWGDAMLAWDSEGRLRELNPAAERLLGARREALLGRATSELLGATPEALASGARLRIRRPDGSEVVVVATVGRVHGETEVHAHASLRDVSEVVAAEQDASERLELLRELTEQHMVLLDNAPLLIFRLDPSTVELLYVNRHVESMLGVSSAQALSTPGFLRGLHLDPDGVAAFDDALEKARAGQVGGPYESRLGPGGREPIIARGTIYPILGDGDRVVGIEGILLDVTGERAIRSRLLESDRLATIGVLAAGVAHEINNPAAFMLLGLDLLSRNIFGPEVRMSGKIEPIVRQLVGDLKDTGRRIVSIARDMRTFASPTVASPGRRAMVDVNRAVESALTLARGPISERADLIVELAEDLPMVALDEGRLAQVVVNLLVNAAQAVGEARSARGAARTRRQGSCRDPSRGRCRRDRRRRHRRRPRSRRARAGLPAVLHDA